jgi:hypothetical protein
MGFSFPPAIRLGTLEHDDRHTGRETVNVTTETRLEEIDPTLLKAWMDKGEAVLVDVREPSEHAASWRLG